MSRTLVGLLALLAVARATPDANERLLALLRADLDAQMRRAPTWATGRGDRRFDDRLPDASDAARLAWLEHARRRLDALGEIDRSRLTPANRTNAWLLEYELVRRLEQARFHPEQTAVTQLGGPQRDLPQLPSRIVLTTPQHYVDYVKRLEAVPAYLDQTIENLRAGLAAGRTPPRVTLAQAAVQALSCATEQQQQDPTLHPMWPHYAGSGSDRDRAARAIKGLVIPAFARFGRFLRDTYIPACRKSIAAADSVDGPAWYRSRLRYHTTLPLTAESIHATGLKEVARIRQEMMAVIRRTDFPAKDRFEGEALFRAFTEYLRTDPRFYFTRNQDLLAGYRDIAKRVDAWMPRLFGKLPRLAYGVKEMPPLIQAASPTAYYYSGSLKTGQPGYFIANTFRLDQRPKYEMVPLTLHEAVPGHHHQIALAQEMEHLPEWRTVLSYTAFGEGWALYAERLGLEMGDLLADPYDDFGRLSYEMWRAMRLVVDTGLHAKGWARQQAIDYMLANSALTRENVAREVDRYIAWPGQACAYKIGELKVRELRARAEKALGARFDLRAFHDTVLEEGSIPLAVLERRIDAWIESSVQD
ncbi:MAG: DUF885 domain-containing protein [Planctomycetota bacterium]|jgi:uncharacterized protein (DUF885 family)